MSKIKKVTYPSFFTQIGNRNIYLCDARSLSDQVIREHDIQYVMSIRGRKASMPNLKHLSEVKHRRYCIDDGKGATYEAFKRIQKKFSKRVKDGARVLIHCAQGVSRSVSVIVLHLVKHEGMTIKQAIEEVKQYRPEANPNKVFISHMQKYVRSHGANADQLDSKSNNPLSHEWGDGAEGMSEALLYGFRALSLSTPMPLAQTSFCWTPVSLTG